MNAPKATPIRPPRPPASDVPPRTTAAIAISAYCVDVDALVDRTSAVSASPPNPANRPPSA